MQITTVPARPLLRACLLACFILIFIGCAHQGSSVDTAAALAVPAPARTSEGPCVDIILRPYGTFYSSLDGNNACVYRGIQYATASRWQPPKGQIMQSGGNEGNAFGPVCPQTESPTSKTVIGKEQCLYLNVWTPLGTTSRDRKPVMVFIHGGAFTSGSGSNSFFNVSYFAGSKDVIFVTFNYRLGALGSLFVQGTAWGNYGLMDQEAALEWVRNNIPYFGGDNSNIMMFGESAGAMSVGLHLMSTPRARNQGWLFKSALMESNPLGLPYKSLSDATAVGSILTDAGDLKALSPEKIVTAQGKVSELMIGIGDLSEMLAWAPSVDSQTVMSQPVAGKLPLPAVLGTNRDEGILFAYGAEHKDSSLFTDANYKAALARMFPNHAAAVQGYARYKALGDPEKNAGQMANVIGDSMFTCANAYLAGRSIAPQVGPYLYQFTHVPEENFLAFVVPECAGKVCHAAELPFVFHDDSYLGSSAETNLSSYMAGYWSTLARQRTPGSSPAAWPAYSSTGSYLDLDLTPTAKTNPAILSTANCSFWSNTVGYGTGALSTTPLRAKD